MPIQLFDGVTDVFDEKPRASKETEIDVKSLHAQIGQRPADLDNDFLGIEEGPWPQWRRVSASNDLVLFKQGFDQSNVTSLVERVSRFTVLLKTPNKRTKSVMGKIIKAVRDLPYIARRLITFDRGTEFVSWPHLQAEIGTRTWFCDASSPWQKRHRRQHQPAGTKMAAKKARHHGCHPLS